MYKEISYLIHIHLFLNRVLVRGDKARGVEKFVLCCVKPIEVASPGAAVTPCDLLSRAMINNCDTTPANSSEILLNSQIYQLADQKTPLS